LVVPSGPGNTGPIDLFIFLSELVCVFFAAAVSYKWRFPYALPVGISLVAGALGALVGPVPFSSLVALVQDIALILWCWVVVFICRSPLGFKVLTRAWVYSSIVWGALLMYGLYAGNTFLTGQNDDVSARTALTFGDSNAAGNYLFISIMLIWATGRPRNRVLRILAYALLVVGLATTGSNGSTVALGVGVVVAGLMGIYRRFGAAPLIAAAAVVVCCGYFLATSVSLTDIQDQASKSQIPYIANGVGRSADSVGSRSEIVNESLKLHHNGSALGEGPTSTKARLQAETAPLIKEAHDDYFAALLERGALGLFALLLLFGSVGLRGISITRSRLKSGYAAVITRPNALLGAVAGTFVAATVGEFLHARHVWTLFAFVAALYIWGRE
jgi:O-antigen ligase